jgi:hypothetical protein
MSILDVRKLAPPFDRRRSAAKVFRTTGKDWATQQREILRLQRGIGLLSPEEYYYYRLFDDSSFSASDKQKFLGRAAQRRMLHLCTSPRWRSMVQDKVVFQLIMEAYGFSMPRLVAAYHRHRYAPGTAVLRDALDVALFLRSASYPLFGKPIDGMYSLGSVRLDHYDANADAVTLHNGVAVGVESFARELGYYARRGYLFQEVKHPAKPIRLVCGDRIAGVRIVILMGEAGPEIFRTLWKVPTGPHVADNFWRTGNLLAGIDPGTGRVTRVIGGVGVDQRKIKQHPDSSRSLIGFKLPFWHQLKETSLAAARVICGLSMQAWDIAVCADGPVILEANVGGDFNLPQLASGVGLLDDRFRRFLHQNGYYR